MLGVWNRTHGERDHDGVVDAGVFEQLFLGEDRIGTGRTASRRNRVVTLGLVGRDVERQLDGIEHAVGKLSIPPRRRQIIAQFGKHPGRRMNVDIHDRHGHMRWRGVGGVTMVRHHGRFLAVLMPGPVPGRQRRDVGCGYGFV